jgi:hypothetical protein
MMVYTNYKVLEFRRKFFKIFGAAITITDPETNTLVGYIKMKAWSLRGDIRVFTDKTMQQEIVRVGGRQVISFQKQYDIFDSQSSAKIGTIKQKSLKSIFIRDHMDLIDANGTEFGFVQETSGTLALIRRWIGLIPTIGPILELILLFVVQTFTVNAGNDDGSAKLVGNITHKKNPLVVKMTLDTRAAQTMLDPRVLIAVVSLLSVLDAAKNK